MTAETLGRPHVVLQEVDLLGERGIDALAGAVVSVPESWPSRRDERDPVRLAVARSADAAAPVRSGDATG